MNQLKIKQEFLDNIKNGIKDFEIRKKDYGFKDWTKVELVVMKCDNECNFCLQSKNYANYELKRYGNIVSNFYEEHIKETLIVELKQTEMTAFEIGLEINNNSTLHYWYAGDGSDECSDKCYEKHEDNYAYYHEQIAFMYDKVKFFLKDYFKQGDTLYWYELRLVE